MSRSNPEVKLINPAKRFFEWNGEKGGFKYYDKEKKENIPVKFPFTFIVLDCLATVSGYSKIEKSSFWSNEVRKKELKTKPLMVRSKNGAVCEGVWEKIKGKETGMKFCESVYIAFMESGSLQIGNIKMVGAALTAWINYVSGEKDEKGKAISSPHDVMKGAVVVTGMKEGVNGNVTYQMPVFGPRELKPETEAQVSEMDKALQMYLAEYFSKNLSTDVHAATAEVVPDETDKTFFARKNEEVETRTAKQIALDKQAAKEFDTPTEESDLPW